ncbi:MAG: hypothetical protein KatS3mg042_1179 [Rhodothermaceae bacterium]|nr:MAG: hypothetical protein KatS3mg042_1179 [Rhodothermaceae bacterium]
MRTFLLTLLLGMLGFSTARAQLFTPVETTAGVNFVHNNGYTQADNGSDDVMMNVGTGAAWFDYDNDGDLDLYVTQRRDANGTLPNKLFENNGNGTFTEVGAARGAQDSGNQGCGVAIADYDNDGDKDIYLANCTEDVLLQNQLIETGTPNFVDVTSTAFPGFTNVLPQRGNSASWGDYDEDGCLDLYVANHMPIDPDAGSSSQDFLFHNNCESAVGGTTTFTDVSNLLNGDADDVDADGTPDGDGVADLTGFGFIAAWTDFDRDGDVDLYLMNDCPFGVAQGFGRTEDNKLWRNNGDGSFTEISDTYGPLTTTGKDANEGDGAKPDCQNAMGIAIGDIDHDGDMDYYYTNLEPDAQNPPNTYSATMIENESHTAPLGFTDVTTAAGLFDARYNDGTNDVGRITWGAVFFDYDLDRWQDLAVASGAIFDDKNLPNLLYHNNGTGISFTDVSTGSGIDDDFLGGFKTIVMGDYDNDGDPDLFAVAFGEPVRLYRNDNNNGNNWLIIDLEGDGPALNGSNKDALGARIRVRTSSGSTVNQFWETRSGSSLGGGDDMGAYFGLGAATEADVIIQFPNQTSPLPTFTVPANQRITVNEQGVQLPVEMTSFDVLLQGEEAVLRWTTASETNNAGFEVQQGLGDGTFRTVAFVEGAGTTTTPQAYAYTVAGLTPGTHVFRLRQKDFDGRLFATEALEVFVELPDAYLLSEPYPNPFNPQAQFTLAVQRTQSVRIALFDLLGRQVATLHDGVLAGEETHQFTIDGSGLSSGIYLVRVVGEQFTATRQVTLLK